MTAERNDTRTITPACPDLPRVNILGTGVNAIAMTQAVDQIACWIEHGITTYVVVSAVNDVMEAHKNASLRRLTNAAGLVTPDGMPLVFLSRRLGYPETSRVYGPDLMLGTSAMLAERGFSSFYYGGADGVPEQLAATMTNRFPGLKIAGTYSPPFRTLTQEEDETVIDQINAAHPDVVWVALGCPKQTYWMAEHRPRLHAPVLIGVGAAFDFHTGRIPQAPAWMQRRALEWLFRLGVEPRRLWRRYLIKNPLFMFYVALQLAGLRRVPLNDA